MGSIPGVGTQSTRAREASKYLGGEVRNLTDSNTINVGLFFEGANWKNISDVYTLLLTSFLFNKVRSTKNVLNKHHFIDSA